jgi:hypothetical protein
MFQVRDDDEQPSTETHLSRSHETVPEIGGNKTTAVHRYGRRELSARLASKHYLRGMWRKTSDRPSVQVHRV